MENVVRIHAEKLVCRLCNESKPSTAFSRKENNKAKISTACDECHRLRDRNRYAKDPNRRKLTAKWAGLKWRTGLTQDQWQTLLEAQNYKCAICETQFSVEARSKNNPCVDHDHATGRNRGLLCRRCNQGIGLLQDSGNVAQRAAIYLNRHGK